MRRSLPAVLPRCAVPAAIGTSGLDQTLTTCGLELALAVHCATFRWRDMYRKLGTCLTKFLIVFSGRRQTREAHCWMGNMRWEWTRHAWPFGGGWVAGCESQPTCDLCTVFYDCKVRSAFRPWGVYGRAAICCEPALQLYLAFSYSFAPPRSTVRSLFGGVWWALGIIFFVGGNFFSFIIG